ncbi:MAG TPA: hypothetical protein PLV25_07875, partial [Opitutales bacterium]|nr:hypothetical protein [Opitutales bacterium]
MEKKPPVEVIIFGASSAGQREAAKIIQDSRFKLICFYDNDMQKWGTQLMGCPIVAPEPPNQKTPAIILIGSS